MALIPGRLSRSIRQNKLTREKKVIDDATILFGTVARLPIIATRITAIPEIVAEGVTGMLIPSKDPNALAMAMGKMLDRNTRIEMGGNGYIRVKESFTVDKMVENRMAIYEIALSRRKMG